MEKMRGVLLEMGETVTKTNFQTVGLLEKAVDREVLGCCTFLREKQHKSLRWRIFFFLPWRIVPYSFKARLLNIVWTGSNKTVVSKTEF